MFSFSLGLFVTFGNMERWTKREVEWKYFYTFTSFCFHPEFDFCGETLLQWTRLWKFDEYAQRRATITFVQWRHPISNK
jgi:hypothetical protein